MIPVESPKATEKTAVWRMIPTQNYTLLAELDRYLGTTLY
jgi:hypothetical protein